MDNVKMEENKYTKYILSMKESISNTEKNSVSTENMINQQFDVMINNLNERRKCLINKLNEIKDKKLKAYNFNLNKANLMQNELKQIQIKFDKLLFGDNNNENMNKIERKNSILSQSKAIINKSNNTMNKEIIQEINDQFNVKFNTDKNHKV